MFSITHNDTKISITVKQGLTKTYIIIVQLVFINSSHSSGNLLQRKNFFTCMKKEIV